MNVEQHAEAIPNIPPSLVAAFTRFDQAAQTWGWEADQGVSNFTEARAEWIAAKCDLIADIVDAVEAAMVAGAEAMREAAENTLRIGTKAENAFAIRALDPAAIVKGM